MEAIAQVNELLHKAASPKRIDLVVVYGIEQFSIVFPFDSAILDKVRALPKRRFDDSVRPKRWLVPAIGETARAVYEFAQANKFVLTESALDLIETLMSEDADASEQEQAVENQIAKLAQSAKPVTKEVKPEQHSIFEPAQAVQATPSIVEPKRISQNRVAGEIKTTKTKVVVTFTSIPDVVTRGWMKSVKDWNYSDTKWSFPIKEALKVAEYFPDHKGSAEILAAAKAEADRLAELERLRLEEIRITGEKLLAAFNPDAPLPNGRTLYLHQKEGVAKMLKMQRQLVADEMGLGKTIQGLVVAKLWQRVFNYPIIVVGPVGLRRNWFREAAMVGVKIEYYTWAKIPEAQSKPFILIGDEAHSIQSLGSARTKRFLALAEHELCKGCYPMTGTPMANGRPMNMFPLLVAVRAEVAKDRKRFEKRYCAGGRNSFGRWDAAGASHLAELHELCKPVILRRLKKDCLDLPEKIRSTVRVSLSKKAQEIYDIEFKTRRDDYFRRLEEAAAKKAEYQKQLLDKEIDQEEYGDLCKELLSAEGEQLVFLTHLRMAGSIAKVESTVKMAEEVLENNDAVLIFTDFVPSAKMIADRLSEYGVELLTGEVTGMDKATGETKRQAMVDRFQEGKARVFVSTFAAGGVGITLTRAHDVLLVDRPWRPGDAVQAEDRADRIGQASKVNAVWLQAGKIDEKVDKVLIEKSERIDMVLEGKRASMRGVEEIDKAFIRDLFNSIMTNDEGPDDDSFDDDSFDDVDEQ